MAEGTNHPKTPFVLVVLGVTAVAIRREAFEGLVEVAIGAFDRGMFTIQDKCAGVVVKGGWDPASRDVALGTIST